MASDSELFILNLFWDPHTPQRFNYLLHITKIPFIWHQQLARDTPAPGYTVTPKPSSRPYADNSVPDHQPGETASAENAVQHIPSKTQVHTLAVGPDASEPPAVK